MLICILIITTVVQTEITTLTGHKEKKKHKKNNKNNNNNDNNNSNSPVIPIPTAFKLVEDAIVLIKWTQLTPEVFMHLLKESNEDVTGRLGFCEIFQTFSLSGTDLVCLYWSGFHVEIPNFDRQVVACHHVAPIMAELHIRDGWNYFRKEWTVVWIFWLLEHFNKKKKQKQKQNKFILTAHHTMLCSLTETISSSAELSALLHLNIYPLCFPSYILQIIPF